MWETLIQLNWDKFLPLFFLGVSFWICVALSVDLIHDKEFHIWKALLGLTVLLVVAMPRFTISLVCLGFAVLLGWILAVRFFHFFQSWWVLVVSYELVRIEPVLRPYLSYKIILISGLLLWIYGAFKALSERSIYRIWIGWVISQIGFILMAVFKSQILESSLQYEILSFGIFGTILAGIFNEMLDQFKSPWLVEWEGKLFSKRTLLFIISVLGLATLSGWSGFIFSKKHGFWVGSAFYLGWFVVLLSYCRIGQFLFFHRSLRLEPIGKL